VRVIACHAVFLAGLIAMPAGAQPATRPVDARFAPYAADPEHLWNRLHRALFLRIAPDGTQYIHSTDPLIFDDSTYLLEGERHRQAIELLNDFLAAPREQMIDDPLRRLYLQRDLWAAFDQTAWVGDEWVHHSALEPAAIELRTRLAKAIARLALDD